MNRLSNAFALGVTLLAATLNGNAVSAQSRYDTHVAFDNSLTTPGYYYSDGEVVAPSQLELAQEKFPIEEKTCVTAPNCLRLNWRSGKGGDWRLRLNLKHHYSNFDLSGDTLSFWAYSDTALSADAAPRIYVTDTKGEGSPSIGLLGERQELPARKWTRLTLPFTAFAGLFNSTSDVAFDPAHLAAITLVQGLDDDTPHTVLIDDVRIADEPKSADSTPPASPSNVAARGYERHIELTWTPSRETDLLRYVISRSSDGTSFTPIGVQKGHLGRYVDWMGEPGRTVFYRIAAEDDAGNESPVSAVVSATTKRMTDEELLTMVQEACFRYYWDGAHPNAGMAIEITPGNENPWRSAPRGSASWRSSPASIGSSSRATRASSACRKSCASSRRPIVSTACGRTSSTAALGRRSRFRAYDDGADLVETAFLMQGLLVARQYFDRDTPAEREIRDSVTGFWREAEWDWFRKTPDSDFLYWHWSPDHGFKIGHPLVGWNETMIIYLLAIASPTHAVPASLYHSGWAGQSDLAVRYRRNWGRTSEGDHYVNGHTYYGTKLDVGVGSGGELFFMHFSFMDS